MYKQKLVSAYIIDDSQDAIEVLAHMLENNFSVEVVGKATDAETAVNEVIDKEPDIIFVFRLSDEAGYGTGAEPDYDALL